VTAGAARPYRVAIVGAGIVGLYTAYHLARAGAGPILVVDRGYLSSGASGRNGGGVRQQWETAETVRLARESVAAYRRFPSEFGYNLWFRQGGYLFVATAASELPQLDRMCATVAGEGLPVRRLSPDQVAARAPGLAPASVLGGTFLATDGTLYPFPAIWGLYEAVRELGVEVELGTEVLGVERSDGRVAALTTRRGRRAAPTVVNAAGGWSGELSERAGLPSANRATRHEILATEAIKPFLDPMVVRLRDGLYLSQTMRGEIVGGLTVPHPPGVAPGLPSSAAFLRRMSAALLELFPRLGSLGVLRAWSGFYDDTPDGLPVIGEDPRLPGFVHANGFGGHGFMLAPAATRRVARLVLGERSDLDPGRFGPGRFVAASPGHATERLQLG
jgi:glycine/D-amino acid oxidase-like deaminating enzyme